MFRVIIKNADGSQEWEVPTISWDITEELNKDRSGTFNFDKLALDAVADYYDQDAEFIVTGSYREVYLYDETTLLYSGYISEVSFDGKEGQAGTVKVSSKGFFQLLDKRFTDALRFYANDDSADIAWDLIDYTQNLTYGDFGITRGTHPATKDRQRTFRYDNIKQAIEKMSANEVKEGFDFEVDNSKIFNIYYPQKGSERRDLILEEGFNINTFSVKKTFINAMANQVIVLGAGQDEDALVEVRDAEAVYKENFFLLQNRLSEKDITEVATLQDKGDKYLDTYKYPRKEVTISLNYQNPTFTDYNVGDRLAIKIPSYDIDQLYRLYKRTLKNDMGVTLYFTSV